MSVYISSHTFRWRQYRAKRSIFEWVMQDFLNWPKNGVKWRSLHAKCYSFWRTALFSIKSTSSCSQLHCQQHYASDFWSLLLLSRYSPSNFAHFVRVQPVMPTISKRCRHSLNLISFQHQKGCYMNLTLLTTILSSGLLIYVGVVEISTLNSCTLCTCAAHHADNQ